MDNVSKDFSVDNLGKTGFYGHVYDFTADNEGIGVNDILINHKYLMVKNSIR